MKRTVNVTITKELEIEIPDHYLTEMYVRMFEKEMFELSYSDDLDDKVLGLFKYVAEQRALYGTSCQFIEGLGEVGANYMKEYSKSVGDFISCEETFADTEVEFVE